MEKSLIVKSGLVFSKRGQRIFSFLTIKTTMKTRTIRYSEKEVFFPVENDMKVN